MNPAIYIAIFLPIFIVVLQQNQNKKLIIKQKIISNKRSGVNVEMLELAKRFIDKECLIYTFNSQLTGMIKEVSDGALLVDNGKNVEIINLDYIIRIREYPKGKNGKKKSIVLDWLLLK